MATDKTLNEDTLLVCEAMAMAQDDRWFFPFGAIARANRLASILKQVCSAYHRLAASKKSALKASDDSQRIGVALRVEVEQSLAEILVKHCEDKQNPPFRREDGGIAIGVANVASLAKAVGERVDEIVGFRKVLADKILSEREDHEKKMANLRDYIAELEKSRGEIRDEAFSLRELIRVNDEALLVAADRIHGQSEALAAAATKTAK